MGIFSWLFSKDTEKNSQIRKWVAKEMAQVDSDDPDVYGLFIGLLQTASQCGKYSVEEENNQFYQASKQYLGDATIFEIACYTYFCLENWLVKNQPEFKTDIALPIGKWIVEKFSVTFYLDEERVRQLFAENLNRYQAIIGEGQEVGELYLVLEQRIGMSKGNKFNQNQGSEDGVRVPLDAQYIKNSVVHYGEKDIPILLAGLEKYCNKHTKQQVNQEQNKLQKQQQNQEEQDYLYGMVLVAQKDWVRACKALTKAIVANPKHYEALVQRGLVYLALRQSVDAVQDFTMAIELKPNEPAAYLHRGKCYHRNFRQKEKSLADYAVAIRLAPRDAAGYLGRGQLYDDIALGAEKQAVEKDDQEKYAHVSEEFLAAIDDYSQVIALEPKHDIAHVNRALVYARKARANKSIDFAKNAIADFEQAMSLNWEHGYLYKQQDEMRELVGQED